MSPPESDWPWLNWVGAIDRGIVERIACDATVLRIVLDPVDGLPLDVGRRHRTATPAIRRGLMARDRGCRWPGCSTPGAWTESHHYDHWMRGGRTQLDRMLLLCRWHHRQVHEGGWMLECDPATAEVHIKRPDGRPYEIGPSRPFAGPTTRRPT